jgi:hypothetical protein
MHRTEFDFDVITGPAVPSVAPPVPALGKATAAPAGGQGIAASPALPGNGAAPPAQSGQAK